MSTLTIEPVRAASKHTKTRTRVGWLAGAVPLTMILAVQVLASAARLHNSAFQDEALYLWAGRQITQEWLGGPAPIEHYAVYFSGYPYVYPVIAGLLDRVGGLELARSFSLACMLGVTSMVWCVTRRLFDRPAAVFATAIYAVTGVVLFLSRLATFDALCLFLIALATHIAIRCASVRSPWSAVLVGPVLVLAFGAKYAALLFMPAVFALMAIVGVMKLGWRRATWRVSLALGSLIASAAGGYAIMDSAAFHAITHSTTNRLVGATVVRSDMFFHILELGGIVWGAALVGVIVLWSQRQFRMLALALFGASWLAPIYHVYMREPISIDKHIAYGLFFAAPLAGVALAWLARMDRSPAKSSREGYWVLSAVVLVIAFTIGLQQSHTLFSSWANTTQLSYAMRTQIREGSGRILAEDIEVARFDQRNYTKQWQWSGLGYLYYVHDGEELLGDPAIRAALDDRYYDYVQLSFNYHRSDAELAAQVMVKNENYDLVAVVLFQNSFGKGHYYVFRSALEPGGGTFTNLDQLKTKNWTSYKVVSP